MANDGRAGRYVHFLETSENSRLVGWVYDRRSLEPVALEIRVGSSLAFQVVANIARDDVRAAEHCSAFCGFDLVLADEIFSSGEPVSAFLPDGNRIAEIPKGRASSSIAVFIETADFGLLEGWCFNRERPELLHVRTFVNGKSGPRAFANVERSDVAKVGALTDRCGFRFLAPFAEDYDHLYMIVSDRFATSLPVRKNSFGRTADGKRIFYLPFEVDNIRSITMSTLAPSSAPLDVELCSRKLIEGREAGSLLTLENEGPVVVRIATADGDVSMQLDAPPL